MAQNQIRFSLGLALAQFLIGIYGTNKTGLSGAQKKERVISQIEPLINFGAQVAASNTSDAMSKAEIGIGVQALHDSLLQAGLIHDTAALEAGTAPVAPAPAVTVVTSTVGDASAASQPEQAKYNQWLRLTTPGLMPTNETLKANLFVAGDTLYNDGDAANAAEFYFVVQRATPLKEINVPLSPTNRMAKSAGYVG